MYTGNFVFSQLMAHLPMHSFRRCVRRYHGNRYVKSFTCLDQFLCMAFAQLTHRDPARHRGLPACPPGQTLSPGTARRHSLAHAKYANFAHALIRLARPCMPRRTWGWN